MPERSAHCRLGQQRPTQRKVQRVQSDENRLTDDISAWSGPCHPYEEALLGQPPVWISAVPILVDGNPLEDLFLVANHWGNFDPIMKDGVICKNEID